MSSSKVFLGQIQSVKAGSALDFNLWICFHSSGVPLKVLQTLNVPNSMDLSSNEVWVHWGWHNVTVSLILTTNGSHIDSDRLLYVSLYMLLFISQQHPLYTHTHTHTLSLPLISYMKKASWNSGRGCFLPEVCQYQENRAQRALGTGGSVFWVCVAGKAPVELGTVSVCHKLVCFFSH